MSSKKEEGQAAELDEWKGGVGDVRMVGSALPTWTGRCLFLDLDYINCPVRKHSSSLTCDTNTPISASHWLLQLRAGGNCTGQFQVVAVMSN